MATKTLTLDPLFPDGTPAKGTRLTVTVDRDVAIIGSGVIARKNAVRSYTVGRDGTFPTIDVVPNDDASLQGRSQGYGIIVEAEPTPLGGITGGPWTYAVTSADPDAVRMSDLDPAATSPVPNAQVSPGQIAAAISNSTQAIADSSDAKTSAAAAEAAASSSAADAAASAALVGAPADAAIAAVVTPGSGSDTEAVLNATFARGSGLPVDASNAPGVDATGVADSTTSLQAILDANAGSAFQPNKVVRLQGTFKISSTLYVKGCVDATNAVINYTGAGVAVQIGSAALGNVGRWVVRLGDIICTGKPAGAAWTAGSVGLVMSNASRNVVSWRTIKDFETGIDLVGDGTYGAGGTAYNTFHGGTLDNNLVNLRLRNIAGGVTPFVNENLFLGGSYSHTDGTYPQAGMRHIQVGLVGGSLNNNRWIGASLEGEREEYLVDAYGVDNMFLGCRWEFVGVSAPVRWRASAARNMLIGGYAVTDVTETIDTGAVANNIIGAQQMKYDMVGDGGLILSSVTGGTNSPFTVMGTGWRRSGQTVGANYMTKVLGGVVRLKTTTDTQDRILLDYATRWIKVGIGSAAPARGLNWATGTPEGAVTASPGALYMDCNATTGGLWQKVTGTGNTGWHLTGFPPYTTAGRPTATAAGIGGTYYDTTLSKPGFSDGAAWRDAAGTAI